MICANKICKVCNKEFSKPLTISKKAWEKSISCSKPCSYIYKSQQMKGKIPANHHLIVANLKGKGKWYDCKGCNIKFQSRPEIKHVKTSYCTRKCWLENKFKYDVRGNEHYNWQGGKTKENIKIRNHPDYRKWRIDVLKRDNYTCVNCHDYGCRLEVDHVLPFSLYPNLRIDINNGRTLCVDCHKLIGWNFHMNRKMINVETA